MPSSNPAALAEADQRHTPSAEVPTHGHPEPTDHGRAPPDHDAPADNPRQLRKEARDLKRQAKVRRRDARTQHSLASQANPAPSLSASSHRRSTYEIPAPPPTDTDVADDDEDEYGQQVGVTQGPAKRSRSEWRMDGPMEPYSTQARSLGARRDQGNEEVVDLEADDMSVDGAQPGGGSDPAVHFQAGAMDPAVHFQAGAMDPAAPRH
jgi:hypothetical protein